MTSRIEEIRNLLFTRKKVSVSALSAQFGISEVTIRKDLERLEREGIAQRVYGGAVLAENALPPALTHMEDRVRAELAEAACSEICDGDSIFLGSGKTCCYLAKLLDRFRGLSIVTNNITALGDLLRTDARVYLLGGEVTSTDAHTLFSSPENPNTFTDNIFVSKAFTSISGIDLQAGLTVHSIVSTHIYRNLPSIARSWYLMADSSKFDKIAMYPVAELRTVQCLITDALPTAYREQADKDGVEVRITART
ncbi:MAG: DeoR/GlpR family DNA-binding transcription regulator [Butyricicoccus sp.]